ncbi:hypothetical protein DYB32_008497 [Aphanomyces invadans]|uniref:Uncharacterized protein n=1 Tax=Aphanomyces invadans TaxID=157072 RepID=A0A3R6V5P3_9STRA|nr:hypothetical protein DYB32_008497 [Aphanomyces invadans]
MVCWRTMRGCMRTKLNFMDKIIQGTGTMVEAILGVHQGDVIPASSPAPSNSDEPATAPASPVEAPDTVDEPAKESPEVAKSFPA